MLGHIIVKRTFETACHPNRKGATEADWSSDDSIPEGEGSAHFVLRAMLSE